MENYLDLLDRSKDIENLLKIIDRLPTDKGWCFALNGTWGCGKTWVFDKLISELKNNDYIVFNYNAWQNDFYEEPLQGILSSFADDLNELCKYKNRKEKLQEALRSGAKILYNILGKVSEKFTGVNLEEVLEGAGEIIETLKENKINKDFDDKLSLKTMIKIINTILNKISKESGRRIIILIDELDRCLPEYAIKVLERLHHIFDQQKKCIQILGVDKTQLNNTVKKIFGESVKVEDYLCRFIDFEVRLNNGILNEKYEDKFNDYVNMFEDQLTNINQKENDFIKALTNNIPIRQRIKLIERAKLIHKKFVIDNKNHKCDYTVLLFELIAVVIKYYDMRPDNQPYQTNEFFYPNKMNDVNTFFKKIKIKPPQKFFDFEIKEQVVYQKDYHNYAILVYYFNKLFENNYDYEDFSIEDKMLENNIELLKKFIEGLNQIN